MIPAMHIVRFLEENDVFESEQHRSRFSDLVECYYSFPFFSAGLCKCMYLSSWDEEHFFTLLSMLNTLTLDHDTDTAEMEDNGKVQEYNMTGSDKEIYRMSCAFLAGEPYTPNFDGLDEENIHIIKQGVRTAALIDEVFSNL